MSYCLFYRIDGSYRYQQTWMNAALACIAVMAMLTAQTLWGASSAAVKLDMKEMDSLVKVYSHISWQI